MQKTQPFKTFISIFENLASHKRRYTVFSDFVEMSALALHNGCRPFLTLERFNEVEGQFMAARSKYSDDEYAKIRTLFHLLIDMLTIEPSDVLGQLYMQLELGNAHAGQFFTPDSVSEMMARMTYWDAFSDGSRPYVTFSDPACGAGSTLIAVVKIALEKGKNPLKHFWMHAQDIDRNVALMCYVQLSLLDSV